MQMSNKHSDNVNAYYYDEKYEFYRHFKGIFCEYQAFFSFQCRIFDNFWSLKSGVCILASVVHTQPEDAPCCWSNKAAEHE
jgi:hypothetical protein